MLRRVRGAGEKRRQRQWRAARAPGVAAGRSRCGVEAGITHPAPARLLAAAAFALVLGPRKVRGPARRRALSVSFPRRHWAGRGAGRAAGRRRRTGVGGRRRTGVEGGGGDLGAAS